MRTLAALTAALAFIATPAALPDHPGRYAVLIGGTDDPSAPQMFSNDFNRFQTGLKARGWSVRTVFGNSTDGKVTDAAPSDIDTVNRTLDDAIAHAKSGDEVLIFIHTHGSPARSDSVPGHEVVISGGRFDTASLRPRLETLSQRGVKTAFVDLSCFSGTSQALNTAQSAPATAHPANLACIATLAAPDYVSVCSGAYRAQSFTRAFTDLPQGATDLESQFLKARAADDSGVNVPYISSRDAPEAQIFWDIIAQSDPSGEYLLTDIKPGGRQRCELCAIPARLDGDVRDLRKTLSPAAVKPIEPYLKAYVETVRRETTAYLAFSAAVTKAYPKGWRLPGALAPFNQANLADLQDIASLLDEGHLDTADVSPQMKKELIAALPQKRQLDAALDAIGNLPAWGTLSHEQQMLDAQAHVLLAHEHALYSATNKPHDDQCKGFTF